MISIKSKRNKIEFIVLIIIVMIIVITINTRNYIMKNKLISNTYFECIERESSIVYDITENKKLSCVYYQFDNGNIYSLRQRVDILDDKYVENEFGHYTRGAVNAQLAILRIGIKELVENISEYINYGYGIEDIYKGTYNVSKGRVYVHWNYNSHSFDDTTDFVGEIDNGDLYMNDYLYQGEITPIESSKTEGKVAVYPLKKYKKWNKCRKENNCQIVFPPID